MIDIDINFLMKIPVFNKYIYNKINIINEIFTENDRLF